MFSDSTVAGAIGGALGFAVIIVTVVVILVAVRRKKYVIAVIHSTIFSTKHAEMQPSREYL